MAHTNKISVIFYQPLYFDRQWSSSGHQELLFKCSLSGHVLRYWWQELIATINLILIISINYWIITACENRFQTLNRQSINNMFIVTRKLPDTCLFLCFSEFLTIHNKYCCWIFCTCVCDTFFPVKNRHATLLLHNTLFISIHKRIFDLKCYWQKYQVL